MQIVCFTGKVITASARRVNGEGTHTELMLMLQTKMQDSAGEFLGNVHVNVPASSLDPKGEQAESYEGKVIQVTLELLDKCAHCDEPAETGCPECGAEVCNNCLEACHGSCLDEWNSRKEDR